jgi:hypothetical protein
MTVEISDEEATKKKLEDENTKLTQVVADKKLKLNDLEG